MKETFKRLIPLIILAILLTACGEKETSSTVQAQKAEIYQASEVTPTKRPVSPFDTEGPLPSPKPNYSIPAATKEPETPTYTSSPALAPEYFIGTAYNAENLEKWQRFKAIRSDKKDSSNSQYMPIATKGATSEDILLYITEMENLQSIELMRVDFKALENEKITLFDESGNVSNLPSEALNKNGYLKLENLQIGAKYLIKIRNSDTEYQIGFHVKVK